MSNGVQQSAMQRCDVMYSAFNWKADNSSEYEKGTQLGGYIKYVIAVSARVRILVCVCVCVFERIVWNTYYNPSI